MNVELYSCKARPIRTLFSIYMVLFYPINLCEIIVGVHFISFVNFEKYWTQKSFRMLCVLFIFNFNICLILIYIFFAYKRKQNER